MKFVFVINCTLSYILVTSSVLIKEVGQYYSTCRTTRDRYRYVADKQKIKNAVPYHKIHSELCWNNPSEFHLWPEIDILNESKLTDCCHKYIQCIGRDEKVIREGTHLYKRPLKYYYGKLAETSRKNIKFYETREVRVLKCQVANQRVYRFIKGCEEYSAFFVQATGAAGNYFTIVDVCRTDVFNTIKSDAPGILYEPINSALVRKKVNLDLNIIKNAALYQEIHMKMYGNDLEAYKRWPDLEDHWKDELNILCCKYIECMEMGGSRIYVNNASLVLQMLKYIVDETGSNEETHSSRYSCSNRLVLTLKCRTGYRIRRFIQASDGFSAFLIEPTNAKYNLFIILKACKTSVLNQIGGIKKSPLGRKRKRSPVEVESPEIYKNE